MSEIKILTKNEGIKDVYFSIDVRTGITKPCCHFVSQETENGKPKWEILVDLDHSELKKAEKIEVDIRVNKRHFESGYCYEISFTDDESLYKKTSIYHNVNEPPVIKVLDEDKNKRIFSPKSNITIKNNSYEKILKELKSENNLMKEEETTWKGFVEWFRKELAGISDKNSIKYQEGRKFIEDLEAELNKKTDKGNDNPERERDKKIEKLRRKIAKLEAIVGRTPEQEQDLQDKRRELAELEQEKQQTQNPNKTNWTPWIIGGGGGCFVSSGGNCLSFNGG